METPAESGSGTATTGGPRHWYVKVTVGGEPVEPMLMRSALLRFSEERPFLDTMRFTDEGAEVAFWDEGDSMLDVASLALRLWNEHRESAGLPRWEVLGLEVTEQQLHEGGNTAPPGSISPQEVRPQPL
ncbi:hypothetical protein GCM10011519_09160 [Marmoricola endophyticus]|uniref:Uncharacterized protein n=1 Tax=Marmoricola endophyticus TaxID=2040280 RepID=A0A917BE28_9ACTN|nr:hypothetical protein [Marmoricola endophyticus]GGF37779.1 hypothetical protein GCM10011519_09160 [Marmoricola endophyticus]